MARTKSLRFRHMASNAPASVSTIAGGAGVVEQLAELAQSAVVNLYRWCTRMRRKSGLRRPGIGSSIEWLDTLFTTTFRHDRRLGRLHLGGGLVCVVICCRLLSIITIRIIIL